MDFDKIIKRVIALFTKPVPEMQIIKEEATTVKDLFLNYAIFLAAIPPVMGFLGYLIAGWPILIGIKMAIFSYVISLLGVAVVGYVIDALAPTFGSQKEMVSSFKVAVYTSTPAWVAGVFHIIFALSFVSFIAGIYGIYLAYLGLQHLKESPKDKLIPYLIVSMVVIFVVLYITGQLATRIAMMGTGPLIVY